MILLISSGMKYSLSCLFNMNIEKKISFELINVKKSKIKYYKLLLLIFFFLLNFIIIKELNF